MQQEQAGGLRWYKGNLHAHTDRSDGRLPPGAVVDWYAGNHYDFLALTDHGRVTRYEPRNQGILMIPGTEITAFDQKAGAFHHLLAVMEQDQADALSSFEVSGPQRILAQLTAAGATVVHAHPYWLGLSSAELGALDGAIGVEVYNHLCELEKGRGYSEMHWDDLLLRGRRVWGLAVDDCHWRTLDAGGGWLMVRAARLSVGDIIKAVRAGDFYATQGPEIKRLDLVLAARSAPLTEGRGTVSLECSPCRKVVFYADRWLGAVVEAGGGDEVVTQASYRLTGKETYVRAVCTDHGGRKAWSQPVFPQPAPAAGIK